MTAPARATSPSFRSRLLDDHVQLATLCNEVLATFEGGDRDSCDAAFRELEQRLEEHLAFEDRDLLPALARVDRAEAEALAADHRRLRAHLTEVGVGVDLHATRAHNVRALLADLGRHAQREGELLYRFAGETVDEPTQRSWMQRLRAL